MAFKRNLAPFVHTKILTVQHLALSDTKVNSRETITIMDRLQSLRLPALQNLTNNMRIPPSYTKPLAAVGSIWASYQLYRLANFTWYHFLRPSALNKYKEGVIGSPWALVTGASDGIGVGFAEELAWQGFNVILHGRNAEKLQTVSETLQAQFPGRKFKILVLDAVQDAGNVDKIQAALAEFKDLNLKVLINNVGGMVSPDAVLSNLPRPPHF